MGRRKTKIQSGLSVEKAREIVIRVKKMEGLSKHTIENYNKLFNDLERCFAKNKYMENFSLSDARRFLEWQLTEKQQFQGVRWGREKKIGVSVSSANSYLRLAKGAFSTLINEGHLEENPFMEIKNIKFQKKQVETLTEEEIQRILKSLDHSWFADFRSAVLIHVLLDSFGRIGAEAFKRVEIADLAIGRTFNTMQLSKFVDEQMNHAKSILVILNTKTVVKRLYELFKIGKINECRLFHLSTSMCAAHRAAILKKVRKCLEKKERVICFSTQLIEAGADVSFECVIRSVAGLDSIAQAAGRCNRNGEFSIKTVYIIDHEEESLSRLKEIKKGKKIVLRMLEDMKRNP